jgi:tartrate-resistant acid phosphatase type 5
MVMLKGATSVPAPAGGNSISGGYDGRKVGLGVLAFVTLAFVVMYSSSPSASADEADFTALYANKGRPAPQPLPGSRKPDSPPPLPPPIAVGPPAWMRGTNGRLAPSSAADVCQAVASLGYWRLRCRPGACDPQTVTLEMASSVELRAVRACTGPGCAIDVNARLVRAAAESNDWHVTIEPCSGRGGSSTAAAAVKRDDDVRFDVEAVDRDAAQAATRTCFLSVGDWGKPSAMQTAVATGMRKRAEANRAVRFVISTGDNFYPVGVKNVQDPQLRDSFEAPFGDPYSKQMMWYVSAGNHDQWGMDGQLRYSVTASPDPATGLPYSDRWYFPWTNYALELPMGPLRSARCVVLNPFGKHMDWQLKAMEAEFDASLKGPGLAQPRRTKEGIEAADAAKAAGRTALPVDYAWEGQPEPWRFVVSHAPMYSGSSHGQNAAETPRQRDLIKPFVDRVKTHAYFAGHDHILEVHNDGTPTDYFVSGGGAGSHIYASIKLETTKYYAPIGDIGFMEHCVSGDEMRTTVWNVMSGPAPGEPTNVYEHVTKLEQQTAGN